MSGDLSAAALVARFYAERNREYRLTLPVISIGRACGCLLRIQDDRLAPEHVQLLRERTGWVLDPLATDAPTRVNGDRLWPGDRRALAHGDIVALSDLEFRFVLESDPVVRSRIHVLDGVHRGKTFRIERDEARLGRALDNDVQFPDRSVSRHHCLLRRDGGVWTIEDLDSTNGTLVNGSFLRRPKPLRDGDEVLAGYSRFVFRGPAAELALEDGPGGGGW